MGPWESLCDRRVSGDGIIPDLGRKIKFAAIRDRLADIQGVAMPKSASDRLTSHAG